MSPWESFFAMQNHCKKTFTGQKSNVTDVTGFIGNREDSIY